jgi:hypothetical protein
MSDQCPLCPQKRTFVRALVYDGMARRQHSGESDGRAHWSPFLADVLALEGEDANAIRQGVRVALADYAQLFRAQEVNKRMSDRQNSAYETYLNSSYQRFWRICGRQSPAGSLVSNITNPGFFHVPPAQQFGNSSYSPITVFLNRERGIIQKVFNAETSTAKLCSGQRENSLLTGPRCTERKPLVGCVNSSSL